MSNYFFSRWNEVYKVKPAIKYVNTVSSDLTILFYAMPFFPSLRLSRFREVPANNVLQCTHSRDISQCIRQILLCFCVDSGVIKFRPEEILNFVFSRFLIIDYILKANLM